MMLKVATWSDVKPRIMVVWRACHDSISTPDCIAGYYWSGHCPTTL